MSFTLINASAGSGKTYTLTRLLAERLEEGLDPSQVIATTFTVKPPTSSQRVRSTAGPSAGRGRPRHRRALISTVNSVAGRLVTEYALDAGISYTSGARRHHPEGDLRARSTAPPRPGCAGGDAGPHRARRRREGTRFAQEAGLAVGWESRTPLAPFPHAGTAAAAPPPGRSSAPQRTSPTPEGPARALAPSWDADRCSRRTPASVETPATP